MSHLRPPFCSALFALVAGVACAACAGSGPGRPPAPAPTAGPPTPAGTNEVIVLGTIHDRHRTSPTYGLRQLDQLVRTIAPDYVLAEIPPDRFPVAQAEFSAGEPIREPRVRQFPEYTEVIFPLSRELSFEIIPCAAWTREMDQKRRQLLAEWKETRPADSAEVANRQAWMARELAARHLTDDPLSMHTDQYDEVIQAGLEPYSRLFSADLGDGGWEAINAAHYALIARALDAHRGEGKRFLVTFGAWHKYWLRNALRQRDDIRLVQLADLAK